MKKRTLKITISFLIVFIVLMVFATLFDVKISQRLAKLEPGEYHSTDPFSMVFAIFGDVPLYLLLCYAFAVIFWNAAYFSKPVVKYSVCIAAGLAVAVISLFIPVCIHYRFLKLNGTELDIEKVASVFNFLIMISLGTLSIAGVMFTGKNNIKKQLSFAVIIIFVIASSQLITHGLKSVSKRVRYGAMNALGDFSYFTPWYSLNGFNETIKGVVEALSLSDAVKSFPSGHATAAGAMFTLIAIPQFVKKLNDTVGRVIFFAIPIVYTALVSYARVRMGVHFCTDVIVGGAIAFWINLLAVWLVYYKKSFKRLADYCESDVEE